MDGAQRAMTKAEVVTRAALAGAVAGVGAVALGRRSPPAGVAMAAAAALAARGAFARNSPIFGRVITGARDRDAMSLTFDDGPGVATPAVLDRLAAAGARATFFALGRQIDQHPELARRIVAEGHQLASHGYDHGILVFRGAEHVRDQLRRTEYVAAQAVGPDVLTKFFRPPHGFRGPRTTAAAASLGYRTVGWTVGVFDSEDPGADVIAGRAIGALGPGVILLLHDADGWYPEHDRTQTADALEPICAAAAARGLRLARLDELDLP